MTTRHSIPSDLYDFHHLCDPITLPVVTRILKLRSMRTVRKRFTSDFASDTGVINLLRQRYLARGHIADLFSFYQQSRLDPFAHRYESLVATLIVTIVGTVVGGIMLEYYKDNRRQIEAYLIRTAKTLSAHPMATNASRLLKRLCQLRVTNRLVKKFSDQDTNALRRDFRRLLDCFIARDMHQRQVISFDDYSKLVKEIIEGRASKPTHHDEFIKYRVAYERRGDAISEEKSRLSGFNYHSSNWLGLSIVLLVASSSASS